MHGRLAEFSTEPMHLPAMNTAGVVRALCALKPGFESALREGHYRLIRGNFNSGLDLDESMLTLRTAGTTLHLLPVAEGAKNSGGVGKIIVGAVIVVASVLTYGAAAGAFGSVGESLAGAIGATTSGISLGFATPTFGSLALFGAGVLLSGISTVLSPQAKKNTGQNNNSYGLGGRLNSTTEGGAIPILYGRTLVGSTVVSVGFSNEDLLTNVVAVADNLGGSGGSGTSGDFSTGAGGSSGKGSSSSGGSTQAANTLQSKSIVRIIDVLGEGQISLVNGAQSIYFNNTPLQASDGTYNFQGVNWDSRIGLPDQAPVSGYPSAEQSFNYNIQVTVAGLYLIQNVTSATADRASVTLQIPALYSIDPTNGSINVGPDLSYQIMVQPVEGAWVTVVDTVLTGQKCVSPYEVTYSFHLPNAGDGHTTSWNIKVIRLTPDNSDSNIADDLYWATYSLITDHQLIYPDTAYVALTIDASSFGSQIPTRTYECERIDVQVPENFDPVARTYSTTGPGTSGGTWDGVSWKYAVTDDPAWCLLDLLKESRFGVGLSPAVTETTAYDLYTISQYCNQSVPDGFGGSEPRYTLNVLISSQADAYQVVQSMVSAFRGMTYWGAGAVVVAADMPAPPVSLVTPANTVNGEFTYEGTGLNTRHNMARVTWIDPGNQYHQAVEVVEDSANIALRGIVPTDLIAFGCQSRGLAHRLGKWLLDTEQNQTQTLTHQASFDQISVRPGQIFAQTDPSYAGLRLGGRVRAGATTTVVPLDAYIESTGPGSSYGFCCQMPDGSVSLDVPLAGFATSTDANGVQYSVFTLASPLPAVPEPDAVYLITSTNLEPQQWRCIGMTEPQRGIFQLVSLQYDPNKFARVEYGINLTTQTFSVLPSLLLAPLPGPTNVAARDYLVGVGTTTVIRVTVSWSGAYDPRVKGYQISANSSNSFSGIYSTTSVTYDIDNLPKGEYVFGVRSVGAANQTSAWVYATAIVVDGVSDPPDAPTAFTAIGGTRRIQLNWIAPPQRDILYYELWRSTSPSFSPGLGATVLLTIAATSYTDNDSINLQPLTSWYYWVRAISTTLADGAFAGPVGAETTALVADSIQEGIVNTASFAEGITPVVLIPNIATAIGSFDGEIAYDETTGALYKWSSGTGAWVAVLNATTSAWFDSITAGIASFGGLHSDQIAAGAIRAEQLASDTLITESAQIGNLVVGTSNIAFNSATETYIAESTDLINHPNGEVQAVAVSVPDSGALIVFVKLIVGTTYSSGIIYTGGESGGGGGG